MATSNRTVRVFMLPLMFPCGPQSACCGPIGQSEEEVQHIKRAIENELGCSVEIRNVTQGADMREHPAILRLLRAFGPMALPIITLEDEVISLGNPTAEQAVRVVSEKLMQLDA